MQPNNKKFGKPLQSPTEAARNQLNRTAKSSEGLPHESFDPNYGRPMTSQKIPATNTGKLNEISGKTSAQLPNQSSPKFV